MDIETYISEVVGAYYHSCDTRLVLDIYYIHTECDNKNAALKRKLESKAEALLILSEELTDCRRERDELRSISQGKHFSMKELWSPEKYEYVDSDSFEALKEKNKALFIEIRDLRHKLQESYSDLKVLRSERSLSRGLGTPASHLKEEFVQDIEESKAQIRELRSDLQALLDEKEVLVTERDAYRCKVHRLNHEITNLLKLSSTIDIDSILMENKYTKERLEQALNEIEIAKHTLSKYKVVQERRKRPLEKQINDDTPSVYFKTTSKFGMLDKKKMKGSMKLGNSEDLGCRVITQKQVLELLEKEESIWRRGMLNKEATLSDLRGLCMALVDSMQDKSLSLSHQKKANRILAERVKYLEEKLAKYETINPCHLLLEGYSTSEVDSLPPIKPDEKVKKKELVEASYHKESTIVDNTAEDEEKLPQELQDLINEALHEVQQAEAH